VSTTEPVTVDDFDERDEDEPELDEPELDEPSPEPVPPVPLPEDAEPLLVLDVPPEPDTTAPGDVVAAIELDVEVW
jgi:hypothetical protein